jgi:hypothetical protein
VKASERLLMKSDSDRNFLLPGWRRTFWVRVGSGQENREERKWDRAVEVVQTWWKTRAEGYRDVNASSAAMSHHSITRSEALTS